MTIRLLVLLAIVACHRDPAPTTAGSAVGSADPWSAPPVNDELPDTVGAKALADKACPRVVAPYYFSVTKDGKTSYMLGTRHLGVPLAKLPEGVKDQIKKAQLVVFETPPGDDGGDSDKPKETTPLSAQLGDQA